MRGVRQRGFTYLALLFAIALAGVALAATGVLWSAEAQREKERELLFVGEAFRQAIGTYYEESPGLSRNYPASLDDLVRDHRHPGIRRHLRRIYLDPMTGNRDWGLVAAPEGGIMGVYSRSTRTPIKRAGFPLAQADFNEREQYSDWRFVYRSEASAAPAPGR